MWAENKRGHHSKNQQSGSCAGRNARLERKVDFQPYILSLLGPTLESQTGAS